MKKIGILTMLLAVLGPVSRAEQAADAAGKTVFIDVHEFTPGAVTASEIAKAHSRDVAVAARFGVRFIEYWIDAAHGRVYSLVEAADAASITAAHAKGQGLSPARILAVSAGAASKALGGRPLFLDIHEFGPGNVEPAAVAGAHLKDLEVESQYGVNFINYWVDTEHGSVFCLSEADTADEVVETHRHAHGLLPATVVQVTPGQ
ncbi:MAG: DUF4242 domain-containing protein [Opitutaceae bacterium]|nr:DUF4242 domain-containing protein [Opitutaceae bacterium]